MKTITNTPERLVFRARRLPAAVVNLVLGPAVIWLGLLVVEDGIDAWLGWCVLVLGVGMALLGVWALFASRTLELDRDRNVIWAGFSGPMVRWDRQMPLDALEDVTLDWTRLGPREAPMGGVLGLAFHARAGSLAGTLRLREFWTRGAADDVIVKIRTWLRQAGHPAGSR